MSNTLRTGFTTGTCAAAGAKAGVLAIKEQKNIDTVDVLLPRGTFAKIQIIKCEFQSSSATCTVIKDGGDDPDVISISTWTLTRSRNCNKDFTGR